jgi:hypothetical protein
VVAADLLGDLAADPALRVQQKVSRVATQMRRSSRGAGEETWRVFWSRIPLLGPRASRERVWGFFPPA